MLYFRILLEGLCAIYWKSIAIPTCKHSFLILICILNDQWQEIGVKGTFCTSVEFIQEIFPSLHKFIVFSCYYCILFLVQFLRNLNVIDKWTARFLYNLCIANNEKLGLKVPTTWTFICGLWVLFCKVAHKDSTGEGTSLVLKSLNELIKCWFILLLIWKAHFSFIFKHFILHIYVILWTLVQYHYFTMFISYNYLVSLFSIWNKCM